MRKLALTLAICLASCIAAYAGPEAFSGKEMKQVAPPPPPPCFNWTGFYLGGFGGYKYSNVDLNLSLSGEWNTVPGPRDMVESAGSGDLNNSGAELGGLLGYNYQWNCWVVGLEVDGGYLWARNSSDNELFFPPQTFGATLVRSSFKTHYLVTVAPRFGYAFGRWLPYVTGGLAVGDLDYAQQISFPGEGPTAHEGASRTETNAGWMVGGGLQYAITDHWSVRAQYQYIDLGSTSFDTDFPEGTTAPAHHHAELTEHNVSGAIMFKF
jgi:outer membrane immunogenic protein